MFCFVCLRLRLPPSYKRTDTLCPYATLFRSYAMTSLDNGRMSVGADATAYARRALDSAVRYATERKAFGEPIANFQLIQQMLAQSEIDIYAAECMMEIGRASCRERVCQSG